MANIPDIVALIAVSAQVVKVFEDIRDVPHDVESMVLEVSALTGVLQALSDLLMSDNTSGASVVPTSAIEACKRTLDEIMEVVRKLWKPKRLFAIRWVLYKDKFQRLKGDLDRHKATFSVLLSGYAR